jgi:hypothetical protein
MNEIRCPVDDRHGPHPGDALWCWVCGAELLCEACGRPVETHFLFKSPLCPVVLFRPRALAS